MTNRVDVARGRDIITRWCNLAERRLEYLTELLETGRWRRYHSERAFLENITEARAAVETWRNLLTREASLDNSAIDMSWLERPRSPVLRGERFNELVQRAQPQPESVSSSISSSISASVLVEPARDVAGDFMAALERHLVSSDEKPAAPVAPGLDELPHPLRNLDAMQERYPLLRNAL